MTALPDALADRPLDPGTGYPVPFASSRDDGSYDLAGVEKRRAVQCALSRLCGMCGRSQEFPLAFLGTEAEEASDSFSRPGMHPDCAEVALRLAAAVHTDVPVWILVETGSFQLERPATKGEPVRFHPGARTGTRRYDVVDGRPVPV